MIKQLKTNLLLLFFLILGFVYRIYGLKSNYSFWTDEAHVAVFVRAILERGKPVLTTGYSTGIYQWLQYWLSAISAKIFGLNEFALRFPSVVFGILCIWMVYILGKELINSRVGVIAAALGTFLKIEILWSRQARPYQALQFFYLLAAYFIFKLTNEKEFHWGYFLGFLVCGILASLMHGLGLIIFLNGFLYLLFFRLSWFKKWWWIGGLLVFLLLAWHSWPYISAGLSRLGKVNNLFYYRVFLWHNYPLLVFLALVGLLSQIFQERKSWQILALFLVTQGVIVSFFLGQPFVRYFYVVFPFLILLSAVGLVEIARHLRGGRRDSSEVKYQFLVLPLLVFFIIAMGNKFTLFPKKVYSLNEDMQEIPEVDWKKVYGLVEDKLEEHPNTVLLTNWTDLPVWFLGEGELSYLLRKDISVETDFFTGAKVVPDLAGFKEVVQKEEKGLIIIDSWDNYVPPGIREYSRQNLKKELEVDRLYEIQPRYWPVTVYSWGI